mmetsp:Transcript_1851/g.6619  ORF Transcript_1851/g.6619 Transcript_1851/m.6619 type:complete len:256 (-) Transcript_1851:167-934(-)
MSLLSVGHNWRHKATEGHHHTGIGRTVGDTSQLSHETLQVIFDRPPRIPPEHTFPPAVPKQWPRLSSTYAWTGVGRHFRLPHFWHTLQGVPALSCPWHSSCSHPRALRKCRSWRARGSKFSLGRRFLRVARVALQQANTCYGHLWWYPLLSVRDSTLHQPEYHSSGLLYGQAWSQGQGLRPELGPRLPHSSSPHRLLPNCRPVPARALACNCPVERMAGRLELLCSWPFARTARIWPSSFPACSCRQGSCKRTHR